MNYFSDLSIPHDLKKKMTKATKHVPSQWRTGGKRKKPTEPVADVEGLKKWQEQNARYINE